MVLFFLATFMVPPVTDNNKENRTALHLEVVTVMKEVFFGSQDLPLWGIVIRVAILYIALIIATRIMRERQVGILSGHNYLVAAGIVSLAAVRMVHPKSSLIEVLIIIFTYAIINAFTSFLDLKFPRLVDRIAIPLVLKGQIIKKNLDATHITLDNFLAQLRLKEAGNLSELEEVYLEPTGKINVLKKPAASPPTKSRLNVATSPVAFPEVVIYDGVVQAESLKRAGYEREWLEGRVKAVYPDKTAANVFLGIIETDGSLYLSSGEEAMFRV